MTFDFLLLLKSISAPIFMRLLFVYQLVFITKFAKSCVPNGICGANPMCQNYPSIGLPALPSVPGPPSYISHKPLPLPIFEPQPYNRGLPRQNFAPPLPSCQVYECNDIKGGGRGSYACGPYGCYRKRALGSTSFQPTFNSSASLKSQIKTSFLNPEKHKMKIENIDEEIKDSALLDLLATSPSIAAIRRTPQKYVNPNRAFMDCCLDRQLPDACLAKCNFESYTKESITLMFFRQDNCPLVAMREIQFCAAQGADHRACCERNGMATTLAGRKCLTFCDQRPGKVTQLDLTYIPCYDRFESMKSCFYYGINKIGSKSEQLRLRNNRIRPIPHSLLKFSNYTLTKN